MAGSLFDKRKRENVRGAIARGDLERVLRKKHEAPPEDEATTLIQQPPAARARTVMQGPAPAAMVPPPLPRTAPAAPDMDSYMHSQILAIDSNHQKNEPDQALFDAIKDGNMQRAIDAITRGANVNSRYTHLPGHRRGDCIIFGDTTPLEYARKKGRQDFVEMLRRYGAKG